MVIKLNGDPFDKMSLEDIKGLPEAEYRLWTAHKLNNLEDNQKRILRRPEVLRANLSLLLSGIALGCVLVGTLVALGGE